MKRISLVLLPFLLISTGLQAQRLIRQIGERLENVAEEKAAEAIGNKLEQKLGEVLDELYSLDDDSTSIRVEDDRVIMTDERTGEEVELTSEPADDAPANVEASPFIGSFVIETREYNGDRLKRDYPMIINYFVEPYEFAFQVPAEEGEVTMIMHRQTRKITQKMIDEDGNKTAMVMPMLRVKVNVNSEEVESEEFSITPTGNTKTISGFTCQEYNVETEDQTGTLWATNDWNFDYSIFFDFAQVKNASTGNMTSWSNTYGVNGMVLEARMEDKNGNDVSEFFIRDINQGSHPEVFSTDGFEVNDVSGMFGN